MPLHVPNARVCRVFLPGDLQGRRGLVGCHLWGRIESDTTEGLRAMPECAEGMTGPSRGQERLALVGIEVPIAVSVQAEPV